MRLNNETELETDTMVLIKKLIKEEYEIYEAESKDGEKFLIIEFASGLIMKLDELPRNFI